MTMRVPPKLRRKRNKANPNNIYFNATHEKAVVDYASSIDFKERDKIYTTILKPVLREIIDKIVFKYKFNALPNIDVLKDECEAWIGSVLDKFDTSKGFKAFSYFSVITKNWFIFKVKTNAKQLNRELPIEETIINNNADKMSVFNRYEIEREQKEFIKGFFEYIKFHGHPEQFDSEEKKVYYAIEYLVDNIDLIDDFNKKRINLFIDEYTKLESKKRVKALKKFKTFYNIYRKKVYN